MNLKRLGRLEKVIAAKPKAGDSNLLREKHGESTFGTDLYFGSAEEAHLYCAQLADEGIANLFRGQFFDWPLILPSLLRPGISARESHQKLDVFLDWARSVPQMAQYWQSTPALTSIAQHYGIPTKYLDLTSDPDIAFLFAMGARDHAAGHGRSVVYCFSSSSLSKLTEDQHNTY